MRTPSFFRDKPCMITASDKRAKRGTSDLGAASSCLIPRRSPPNPRLLLYTHARTKRRQPSPPHYLPVETFLIHIVCSLRPHFSFPLKDRSRHAGLMNSRGVGGGQQGAPTWTYGLCLTEQKDICVCVFSFWSYDDEIVIRSAVSHR